MEPGFREVSRDNDDALSALGIVGFQFPLGLFGVLLYEPGRWSEYSVSEPEGLCKTLPPGEAQMFVNLVDEADVAAGETVDGLPVVTYQEVGEVGLL